MASVTLSDVARAAGVSLATASRAINGSANRTVRADLQERVLEAAAALGYSPDANAQAMARGRTSILGLIVHDIADPYFSSIAAGVSAGAEESGLVVTLASTGHRPEREPELVTLLQSQRARAIVIAGGRQDNPGLTQELDRAITSYQQRGGTVAMVAQPILDVHTISIDNKAGAAALAAALIKRGYSRFAVLAGPKGHMTAAERTSGFVSALADAQIEVRDNQIIECEFTRDGGYEGAKALLAANVDVEAIFAVNDVMAVGAMAALRDVGLRVGADVAVAGFDDIETLRDITPGLTTVAVPLQDVGRRATRLALAEPGGGRRVERVATKVMLRDSTPRLG